MELQKAEKCNETSIILIGKLCTLNDYQQLRNFCNNLKIKGQSLVIDLHRLTFSSSHGLGELVAISNSLLKRKIKLILFNPREEINAVLNLAGIDKVLTVTYTEEELIKKLQES